MSSQRSDAPERRLRADRARQAADVIRQQVVQRAFPAGVLPDERFLAAEFFGVPQHDPRGAGPVAGRGFDRTRAGGRYRGASSASRSTP